MNGSGGDASSGLDGGALRELDVGALRGLGVDAGASSTKWLVLGEGGAPVAEGRSSPITGHIFDPEARRRVFAALDELAAQVAPHRPAAAVAGITGLDAQTPEAAQIAERLRDALGLADGKVRVYNDMDLAYRANFAPGEGILVYAGTGSVAYHVGRDGEVARAGGHGFLIGDEGGGFWVGKTALRTLMRWHDLGEAPSPRPLAASLYGAIGGSDWPRIRAYVYGGGRQAVAALAPAVGQAARQGDPDAHGILTEAGRHLAGLARTLRARLGDLPVVLCGGALRIGDSIERGVQAELDVRVSHASAALAAAQMARTLLKG